MKVNNVNETLKNIKTKNSILKQSNNNESFDSLINSTVSLDNNNPVYHSPSTNLYIQNIFIDQFQQKDEKKLAKKNIKQMLIILEKIRDDMIEGNINIDYLNNLEDIIYRTKENFDDPQLNQILNEVELRAAVELSKLKKTQMNL